MRLIVWVNLWLNQLIDTFKTSKYIFLLEINLSFIFFSHYWWNPERKRKNLIRTRNGVWAVAQSPILRTAINIK